MPKIPNMPRPRKTGDTSYNARRRYFRAAERDLKKAEGMSGASSARYRQLAKQNFMEALSTYDPSTTQKFSRPMLKLANEFGLDLDQYRKSQDKIKDDFRKRAIEESGSVLERNLRNDAIRREREARALLNDDRIGSRILGGFVDIWREDATVEDPESGMLKVDNTKILPSLYEYFGVDNLADMIEKVEEIVGDKLYSDADNDTMYEAVKLMIQVKVAEGKYAA